MKLFYFNGFLRNIFSTISYVQKCYKTSIYLVRFYVHLPWTLSRNVIRRGNWKLYWSFIYYRYLATAFTINTLKKMLGIMCWSVFQSHWEHWSYCIFLPSTKCCMEIVSFFKSTAKYNTAATTPFPLMLLSASKKCTHYEPKNKHHMNLGKQICCKRMIIHTKFNLLIMQSNIVLSVVEA